MNILVFNIETIPDIDSGQRVFDLQGLDQKSTSKALHHLHKQQTGKSTLPLYLQKIVAISIIYRGMGDDMDREVSVESLGSKSSSEAELLRLWVEKIEERSPVLVSWNGSSYDLPVVHYRLLKNQISAPKYWENSDNNYLSRYHEKHTDLMDVLASYRASAQAPLDGVAKLLGFPGNVTLDSAEMWDYYQARNLSGIRQHGEVDALNIYLVYLRYQFMRGEIDQSSLDDEYTLLREALKQSGREHLLQFSKDWAH